MPRWGNVGGSGDSSFQFFVVKSGEIEILDYSGEAPKTITIHHKGQFTGDISHLTGARSVFTAIARGECEVFEISAEALRHVLNQCPGLSDIILQALSRAASCCGNRLVLSACG